MPPRHDRRKRDKLLVACTAICTLCAIVMVAVGGPSLLDVRSTADQIQQSRVDNVMASCRDQNERHDFALMVTNRLLARPAVKPARKLTPQERAAQQAAVRTWVNALVPERDCAALVRRFVSP